MSMKYFICADFGTTALKIALVDSNFNIRYKIAKDYTLLTLKPGYAELPSYIYWDQFV